MRLIDVTGERINALESGAVSSAHVEQMAIDMRRLAHWQFGTLGDHEVGLASPRFLDRMRAGAALAWDLYGEDLFDVSQNWTSDTARGWAAFAVAHAGGGKGRQLTLAEGFARDGHFAVREWAWLGARPAVLADPHGAIDHLSARCASPSPNLRRFCSEVTRPRSVWGPHLPTLKTSPHLGEPILEQLVLDASRYVQVSVANWVNDVARTDEDWVRSTCGRWLRQHGAEVAFVVRRGMRSLT